MTVHARRLPVSDVDPPVLNNGAEWKTGTVSKTRMGGVTYLITSTLQATAALDFTPIAAQTTLELTITVTGAAVGDSVDVTPNGAPEAGLVWSGYVSAANTVTVRLGNVTVAAIDPASRTWRALVRKIA
jgi:hypothetical protein